MRIGRIVHYHVMTNDTDGINSNVTAEGEVLPAIIVRDWGGNCVNLQVFTDCGPDVVAKTSVQEGDAPGNWSWPIRD